MGWLLVLLAALLLAASGFGTFYILVKWILTDAPPGTRFCGISNGGSSRQRRSPREDGGADGGV